MLYDVTYHQALQWVSDYAIIQSTAPLTGETILSSDLSYLTFKSYLPSSKELILCSAT